MGAGPGCAGAELAGPAAGEHSGQVSDRPQAAVVALLPWLHSLLQACAGQ